MLIQNHLLSSLAAALFSMVVGALLMFSQRERFHEEIYICPKVEELEKVVKSQAACDPEACSEQIERWGTAREYPCKFLHERFYELEAKYERKCPDSSAVVELRACESNLGSCELSEGYLKQTAAECCTIDEGQTTTCTSDACKKRHEQ